MLCLAHVVLRGKSKQPPISSLALDGYELPANVQSSTGFTKLKEKRIRSTGMTSFHSSTLGAIVLQ